MSKCIALGLVIVVAVAVRTVTAQVEYTLVSPNEEYQGYFGYSVSGAGDVDNDGFDDVIVGAYREDPGSSPYDCGRAYIFSGAHGGCLDTLVSPNEEADGRFGFSVSSAGDVNNDSYADVIVGAHVEDPGSAPTNAGRAYIFSGTDGTCLDTLASPLEEADGSFAMSVSGAGDVDNDGHDDVIVGAGYEDPPGDDDGGRAYVFSGATGACLDTLLSPFPQYQAGFGRCVSGAGDVNDDGHDDVIVGAWREDAFSNNTNAGRAHVFSGATGAVLHTLAPLQEYYHGYFGWSVAGAGDVDLDGHADVVVGGPGETAGGSLSGRVYIFSGATGDTLRTIVSPNPEASGRFGWSTSNAGDVDFDGYGDLLVGADQEGPGGRAYILSGGDGSLLYTLISPNEESGGRFGFSVSGAGDVNSDGFGDVIAGAYRDDPGSSPGDAGRAYVYTLTMTLSGSLLAGQLVLDWPDAPGANAYWVYGADNLAHFSPGFVSPYAHRLVVLPSGTTTWTTSSGVGDPDHNWTYLVAAVDAADQVLFVSNRFGEYDYGWNTSPFIGHQ